MKRLLRASGVQRLLARLVGAYAAALTSTLRWTVENQDAVEAALAAPEGILVLVWHGRIAQLLACRPILRSRPARVMISLSRDGAFIAAAAERLGIPAIRGSASRPGEPLAKGGADAFRRAAAFIGKGGVVLITPDGPRGPPEVLPPGPIRLARASGCPVFLMGLAARPAWAVRSWDRARFPLPFARARLVFDGPLRLPSNADETTLETQRVEWQARLRAAQTRAEGGFGPAEVTGAPKP